MKNSAWDHKLWSNKLDQLHLKEKADTAWTDMRQLLDEQLPQEIDKQLPKPKINNTTLFYLFVLIIVIGLVLILVYSKKPVFSEIPIKNQSSAVIDKKNKDKMNKNRTASSPSPLIYNQKKDDKLIKEGTKNKSSHRKLIEKEKYPTHLPTHADADRHQVKTNAIINYLGLSQHQTLRKDSSSRRNQKNVPRETSTTLPNINSIRMNELFFPSNQHKINFGSYSDTIIKADLAYRDIYVPKGKLGQSPKDLYSAAIEPKKEKKRNEKMPKDKFYQSWISYGLTIGTSMGHAPNQFLGADASLKIYNRIRINSGLFLHQKREISGSIVHPSYFRPDSIAPFSISDVRKINVISIPLDIEVRTTNALSIKGGLMFNILQKQYGSTTKINSLPNKLDTLNQSLFVNRSLQQTQFIPANLSFNLGVGYHYRGFNLTALYVRNFKSYQVISPLGNYSTRFQALQLGLGYQFNLMRKNKESSNKKDK